MIKDAFPQSQRAEELIKEAKDYFEIASTLVKEAFSEITKIPSNGCKTVKEKSAERCRGLAIRETVLALEGIEEEAVMKHLEEALLNVQHVIMLTRPPQDVE